MTMDERDPQLTDLELDDHQRDDLSFDLDDAPGLDDQPAGDPATQLEDLVRWIVNQLVDDAETVSVTAIARGSTVQIQVRLPEADLGKVIGRGGRIAKSIRTVLMIVGSRHHVRVSLDIEGPS